MKIHVLEKGGNDMSKEKITQCREKAKEALVQYRNALLEEFLLLSQKVYEKLDILCEKEIDEEYQIGLEGTKVRPERTGGFYAILEREAIEEFKRNLNNLQEMEGNEIFRLFEFIERQEEWCKYQEFHDMSKLLFEMAEAEKAMVQIC